MNSKLQPTLNLPQRKILLSSMLIIKPFLLFGVLVSLSCNDSASPPKTLQANKTADNHFNPYKKVSAIPLPEGFERIAADSNSFAYWLRNIGLKKDKTVYLYNGTPKTNQTAQFAVLNIPIGNQDLQQCADAVMRLRAGYLFDAKKFSSIVFRDNETGVYQFTEPYTQEHFTKFMERVFAMCGSASLSKQLKSVDIEKIEPGDVLIRGGFPGHAVIVLDVAVNKDGKKMYMLAQSYMPAQDIHILKNPMNTDFSPWYELNGADIIETPEYVFRRDELKGW